MLTINNFKYRKANIADLEEIANLVTDLLGTCNIDKNDNKLKTKNEIIEDNKKEIQKDINNYYVCEENHQIIGACGMSNIKTNNHYGLEIGQYREILYLVVKNDYQKQGIGTYLMHLCCDNINEQIIYEAWGDKEYVNSKFLLEKLGFKLLKDLGDTYYKDNNYCSYCINRNNNCNSCKAQIWIKNKIQYQNRIGAYAIIERETDNKIAIASDEIDVYFFLGGGMEKEETIEEILKREIIEETGYTIKNIKYFDKIESLCYSNKYGNIDMDATIFIAQFDRKIIEPIEKDHKILWVTPQEYKGKLYHKYQNNILDKYIIMKKENK